MILSLVPWEFAKEVGNLGLVGVYLLKSGGNFNVNLEHFLESHLENPWNMKVRSKIITHDGSIYGVFTDPWMVGFYGIHVGKYTSPMDPMGK